MDRIKDETLKLVLDLQDLSKTADVFQFNNKKIVRLKRRTIAELAEDRFAEYLYDVLDDKEIEIYINGNLNGMRPDIMIVKNSKLISIIELKMNFGWCRNIFDPIRDDNSSIYDVHSSQIHDRYNSFKKIIGENIEFDTGNDNKIELTIHKDCKIYYITTNMENYISKRSMMDDYEEFVRRNKYGDIIKFGIISGYYRYNRNSKTWPNKKEISDSIDQLFVDNNGKYGMERIIMNIKEILNNR